MPSLHKVHTPAEMHRLYSKVRETFGDNLTDEDIQAIAERFWAPMSEGLADASPETLSATMKAIAQQKKVNGLGGLHGLDRSLPKADNLDHQRRFLSSVYNLGMEKIPEIRNQISVALGDITIPEHYTAAEARMAEIRRENPYYPDYRDYRPAEAEWVPKLEAKIAEAKAQVDALKNELAEAERMENEGHELGHYSTMHAQQRLNHIERLLTYAQDVRRSVLWHLSPKEKEKLKILRATPVARAAAPIAGAETLSPEELRKIRLAKIFDDGALDNDLNEPSETEVEAGNYESTVARGARPRGP